MNRVKVSSKRIDNPDGSRLYRMVRPYNDGSVGVSLRTVPGEARGSIAYRLKQARATLRGIV